MGLAIRQRPKLELILHTSHSHLFLRLYKDVEIAISNLKTRHLIFVMKYKDHNRVLGQLFLNIVKFSQDFKLDRVFDTIIDFETIK